MAKTKRRSAFPPSTKSTMPAAKERYNADDTIGGVFGFFRDFGTRETIESILVAIILALMFKTFECEAFIIPTGSMAPSLQGDHKELHCENCGFQYRAGASQEKSSLDRSDRPVRVTSTFCPVCQYQTPINNNRRKVDYNPDHVTNNGDRILVNKFIYDFTEPKRYDVIVFKNPNNGKQNFIKRLIGLPGDNILIENGDIYLMNKQADGSWSKKISRKPAHKLRHVLQTVDDTNHIGDKLKSAQWPQRWQVRNAADGNEGWQRIDINKNPGYLSTPDQPLSWLRYRHYRPLKSDWAVLETGQLPERFRQPVLPAGRLIGDHYAYNDYDDTDPNRMSPANQDLGLHWVGDIGLECWVEVGSTTGKLLLDAVEGGAHFTCEIDVATGEATVNCSDPKIQFMDADGAPQSSTEAETGLRGTGKYHIEYVNADDRIHLWINGKQVKFDAAEYIRPELPIPQFSATDAGDAEPLGVAADKLDVQITRLKVVRDIYYTSVRYLENSHKLDNETDANPTDLMELYQNPELWATPAGQRLFKLRQEKHAEPMFELVDSDDPDHDQFLPMGDNSPQSSDGRIWDGPNFVERDMLLGRALFVYWPHSLNKPVRFFPNFGRMGFIR